MTARAEMFAAGGGEVLVLDDDRRLSRRLRRHGIAGTPAARAAFREIVTGTSAIEHHRIGVQVVAEDLPLLLPASGLLVGARVDRGAQPLFGRRGESVTREREDLGTVLAAMTAAGAAFASWRAIFVVGDRGGARMPSASVIETNAGTMARFAGRCVDMGLVPVLVVEVLPDGDHDLGRGAAATAEILGALFGALTTHGVSAGEVVLTTTPAREGVGSRVRATSCEVAEATSTAMADVPAAVGAVSYLCGPEPFGRFAEDLSAVRRRSASSIVGFTVGRALTDAVLSAWRGDPARTACARRVLEERLARLDRADVLAHRQRARHSRTSACLPG
ncbi:putative fructose-bisphosphate aldolase class 1 [Actinomycetospora sp. NBRC 106375]|uniref:class I fructose-bisphosphate aldolase n=1 Tax=Actinomycetospora sp. NBRC 106375 TaxID=3032207 RepID=UPI0024A0CD01|nr:class I fructose-bisphosphate aldolase [Actinomycetospora sp. NBRC 106375]GLZ50344.1 putative fructose-bisphosphate aldolase class 1 [Actinomycetospora sp. NBRC 106375]